MTLTPLFDVINLVPRELILPPANLFLLILVGIAMQRRWPRTGRWLAGCSLAALMFLSTAGGAEMFVAPLERRTHALLAPARAGAQAIVVLAAGRLTHAPEYGGRDIPDGVTLARLRYAAHLQRATGLPVLVSGGNGASGIDPDANDRAYTKADAMAAALREDFGVPVKWIEGGSRDTAENARYSAALLRADGVRRILLVTDAMHMPRAHAAFARTGLDVVSAPTMFYSVKSPEIGAWVPSAEGMRRSWYAIYEWIGIVWYDLRPVGKTAAPPPALPAGAAPVARQGS